MSLLNLALRLLGRDIRSGELTLLMLALTVAVACSTTVSLFADRLHRTMTLQAAEFLAADLVIAGPDKFDRNWYAEAEKRGLKQAQTAEFSSVLLENDEMLLASVKAVSELYPLRGSLKITGSDYSEETAVNKGPETGTAWVEKRILPALKLKLGDKLTVGEKPLTITHIITYEPDRQGDFYSFSPRVMINEADLEATGIIQPGSHVHYFFQLKGGIKPLLAFKRWATPQLNPSQRIMDVHEDRPELGSALSRAERYLGLSSIIVIVIAGVAIAMTTRRYSERHFDTTAILRCLGLKQKPILLLYGAQFIIIGIVAGAIGCLLGWLSQRFLFQLLSGLLPREIANPSLLSIVLGVVTGLAILFGFALPPLIRLKQVSALRVLRRELEPLPSSAWLVVSLSISIIGILIWRYTGDLEMMLTLLIGGSVALLVLGLVLYALLLLAGKWLPSLSLPLRLGLQGMIRNDRASISQILAFSLTFTAMILSYTVRTDLLDSWKKQVPDNAPNHFALNIFPEQLTDFQQEL
ncbi:MAG: ABC transporter permease, partial [Gammaproteobacteria bacterium]